MHRPNLVGCEVAERAHAFGLHEHAPGGAVDHLVILRCVVDERRDLAVATVVHDLGHVPVHTDVTPKSVGELRQPRSDVCIEPPREQPVRDLSDTGQ